MIHDCTTVSARSTRGLCELTISWLEVSDPRHELRPQLLEHVAHLQVSKPIYSLRLGEL